MKENRSTLDSNLLIYYAENDLFSAKRVNDSSDRTIVAVLFHAQQCAEKSLKAYLAYRGVTYHKTHNLIALLNKCERLDREFYVLRQGAFELTPYATKTRYPESSHPDLFTTTADESLLYADKILQFVRSKVEIPLKPRTVLKKQLTER